LDNSPIAATSADEYSCCGVVSVFMLFLVGWFIVRRSQSLNHQ